MFPALITRLRALLYTIYLQFLLLTANITKTQLLALLLQRVQLLILTCHITMQ